MPSALSLVVRFRSLSFIRTGTRKGETENQATTIPIRIQIMTFSNLRGRREIGVLKPIVTLRAKMMNLVRPIVSQENGRIKASALFSLAISSIAMSKNGRK
jgi:hypothetical protein